MNNKNLPVRRTTPLVCVWRSTGDPGMPLEAIWVQADNTKLRSGSADPSSEEIGGLRLCA
jgi:hypothetical protein